MLRSTYQRISEQTQGALQASSPEVSGPPPLPPGWSEHTAPTGHTYYYNAETKESTYRRPAVTAAPQLPPSYPQQAYNALPNLSDPRIANAYVAQLNQATHGQHHGKQDGRRGGYEVRPKPQPIDKPRKSQPIPGHEPWILVWTKYSRRFVYNPVKKTSYWRIPEKLMPGILELDKERIRNKGKADDQVQDEPGNPGEDAGTEKDAPPGEDGDSSEYEEVEVTDDEAEQPEQPPHKRQRTAEPGEEAEDDQDEEDQQPEGGDPVEFTEADFAAQLQAMGVDYDLAPGEYDDGQSEDWPVGAEGVPFSHEDAKDLFKDMLNDLRVSPYSPWEKLLEDGKMVDDPRYTALSTTKDRKACWDEWTRERLAALKEARARQEKQDPRVAYMAFLQDKASPKLYWPEFKRKYKKLDVMKDHSLMDKDREKLYRDYIARLKLDQAQRKADLTSLLKSQPLRLLHRDSLTQGGLPTSILTDVRYVALEPTTRDALIEAYLQTLPALAAVDENPETQEAQEKRRRREKALEERDRAVEEQRRIRERAVREGKARLREGERELEMAMRVDKTGLRKGLQADAEKEEDDPQK